MSDLTTGQRPKRRFSVEEKLKIIEESGLPENSISTTARKYGIHIVQLSSWRRLMKEGQIEAIKAEEKVVPQSDLKALEKKISELERILGRKSMEVEILKEAFELVAKKTDLARAIAGTGRFQMKIIAETLEISRSHLVKSLRQDQKEGSVKRVQKQTLISDKKLESLLREITSNRPSYGYRRACVVLNKKLVSEGLSRVNLERIYRVMKETKLLLPKHVGFKPERKHEDKVITLRSNTKWCSDSLQIRCWDGQKIDMAFLIAEFPH